MPLQNFQFMVEGTEGLENVRTSAQRIFNPTAEFSNFLNAFGFILISAGKLQLPIHKDLSAEVLHCSTTKSYLLAVDTTYF